jgi:uncharacterized paraquat-inducible protein A
MPTHDDYDDDFGPDAEDADADDDSETRPCPECGKAVYEDADRCHHCGEHIVWDTGHWVGRPVWWMALAVAGIVAVVVALSSVGR